MSNKYEQRFFSALKDTFIGQPIKGKSGYVNLMDMKAQYFSKIEPHIKAEINGRIEEKFREELFEKLFSFFDCYLNETGTVFFANSQIHKNLYERVYSDRDDVALFWKTQKLYYVKSEANYEDLQTEMNGIQLFFDASELKHSRGNEKKTIQFYLVKASQKEIVFKIRYHENNQYDRLKKYLKLNKNNDIIDQCLEEFGAKIHPNILFENTSLKRTIIDRKTESRKCLYIENLDDAKESVKVEYSISDLNLMVLYLSKKGLLLTEEDLKKIFSIYKRQNEIDYFIHKDAEGFLKEQFDIYVYNWLFNDLDTEFDAATVSRIQNIKKIAHHVIEYIARFEEELKLIWEKPNFVKNCHYILTLDKIKNIDLLHQILNSEGWGDQVSEWNKLSESWIDEKSNQILKKEFIGFIGKNVQKENVLQDNVLNETFKYLPLNTRNFPELELQIISCLGNIDQAINGVLIKSDNYTALKNLKNKYHNKVSFTYIDPPFNLGLNADFKYKVNYKDSTWLTLLENRISISHSLLKSDQGVFAMRNDYNGNYLSRLLLNQIFGESNFRNEIFVNRIFKNKTESKIISLPFSFDTVLTYSVNESFYYKNPFVERTEERAAFWRHMNDSAGQGTAKIFFGLSLEPPVSKHWKYSQENIDAKIRDKKLKLFCKKCGFTHSEGKVENCPQCGGHDWNPKYFVEASQKKILGGDWSDLGITSNHLQLHTNWNDMPGYSNQTAFSTENSIALLYRLLNICTKEGDLVLDFFLGSGSTIVSAHKLNRKWIGIELDKQFDEITFPRMIETLSKHGGAFKYYEIEQYEEVLKMAKFDNDHSTENNLLNYSFENNLKLLDGLEVDYSAQKSTFTFHEIYPGISKLDLAETISNLTGNSIKLITENELIFSDNTTINLNDLTFESYPFLKKLIYW